MTSAGTGAPLPSLEGATWLVRPETQAVLGTLNRDGFAARVVGGAVRNALVGTPVKDIDIATTAPPDAILRLAEAASLKAIPTGIAHGTVTLVSGHVPFEVTTLRRDVETDGRHAKVAFTNDWAADARRRDFTINALYCDADGVLYDPIGGYRDIAAKRVRFIGDAAERIREDYLRILRFFRFTATYADGAIDAIGLEAATALKDGIQALSGERLRAELLRLLPAPHAVQMAGIMADTSILETVLGEPGDVELLARVADIEQALELDPDPLLRLGALAAARPGRVLPLRDKLKLSGAEFERLARMVMPDRAFDPDAPEDEGKAFLYRHGAGAFRDGALLQWARSGVSSADMRRRDRLSLATRWQVPSLPIRGSDVVDAGIAEGPAVGRIVGNFEDWWIAAGFPDDARELAAALHRFIKASRH